MKKDKLYWIKTVHSLLTFFYYYCIFYPFIKIFSYIINFYFWKRYPELEDLPVNITLNDNHPAYNPNSIHLVNLKGTFAVTHPAFFVDVYLVLKNLLIYASLFYIVFLLRKITNSVIEGNPFIKQNPKRLRIIAIIAIAIPLFLHYCDSFIVLHIFNSFVLGIDNITLYPNFGFDYKIYASVFIGMLSLVFSTVLDSAVKIKEENELTV